MLLPHFAGALGIISAREAADAETTLAVELAPRSSQTSLGDLEAPSAPSGPSSESSAAVKQLERLKNEVGTQNPRSGSKKYCPPHNPHANF